MFRAIVLIYIIFTILHLTSVFKLLSNIGNFTYFTINQRQPSILVIANDYYSAWLCWGYMFKKGYNVFKKAISLNSENIKAQNGWGVTLLENDQLDKSGYNSNMMELK